MLGEYEFSDKKLRDSVGIPPPKNHPETANYFEGTESLINADFRTPAGVSLTVHVPLRQSPNIESELLFPHVA
jgi:hypothetical protein